MRTIGVVTCYALVIVLTLLAPASAQVLDFTTIDVPGASATLPRDINPEGDIVGFYGVGAAFPRLPDPPGHRYRLRSPWSRSHSAPQPSTLRVTSSASTLPGESLMASCSSRAASPPLMSLALPPLSPSGSILRVTSLASTRLGARFMGSCLTSMAASRRLRFLAPPPRGLRDQPSGRHRWPVLGWRDHSWLPARQAWQPLRRLTSLAPPRHSPLISTLGVTSLACTRLGALLTGFCSTRRAAS